jgi:hypothetical protein
VCVQDVKGQDHGVKQKNYNFTIISIHVEANQLLDNSELIRRLKRTKPFGLVPRTLNHKHRAVYHNHPPATNRVWYLTHDTGAVMTVNKGPMQRKHLIRTG